MTYLDTSALIKRFVAEAGSDAIRRLFTAREPIATAKIAYAEVHAALARRHREGDLSRDGYAGACARFERDWHSYVRIELHDEVLVTARRLIARHPLRGYDAVHLASALSLRDALGEDPTFLASDERLLKAARAERLPTLNPETA